MSKIFPILLTLPLLLNACGDAESNAGAYKKSLDQKPEAKKPEEKKPDEKKPDEKKPDEKKPDEKKPEEGNAANGNKLLETCNLCHSATNPAKLNAAIVPKLDDALKNKPTDHNLVKASFEGANRKDLEAALKTK